MGKCYFCGATLETPVYRTSECPECKKDSKICLNCDFYSESSHWECRESIRESVREKDRSNFCDFFKLAGNDNKNPQGSENTTDAFNKLFGD